MTNKLEIERKYLVKFPASWIELAELLDCIKEVNRISQTYLLLPQPNQQAARVRKTISGFTGETDKKFEYNRKEPTGQTGTHKEIEKEISEKEYQNYLKNADPEKREVKKIRFVFDWKDQIFELDLFQGQLKGLAILEIELDDPEDTVELPPFLPKIADITKEKRFNNFQLANKNVKYYPKT